MEKKEKQKLSLKDAMSRQKDEKEDREKKSTMSLVEDIDREEEARIAALLTADKKEEAKLVPEVVFFEGPPSSTEMLIPFLSCFFVIGVIPFAASVNRQFRVKYKITDRRISVRGGWDGKDVTEFSYQEIYEIKYGMRFFGYCADLRIDLRDGAKVEIFGLLDFEQNYEYILQRLSKDARRRCGTLKV